jgi:hypothetical protein
MLQCLQLKTIVRLLPHVQQVRNNENPRTSTNQELKYKVECVVCLGVTFRANLTLKHYTAVRKGTLETESTIASGMEEMSLPNSRLINT